MKYIIDGYNLLFDTKHGHSSLATYREEIVSSIHAFALSSSSYITLVFDSSYENGSFIPSLFTYDTLDVIYAPHDITADEHIIDIISRSKVACEWFLFTNDRSLQRKVKELRGNAEPLRALYSILRRHERASITSYEIEKQSDALPSISKTELEYWLNIFEE